MCRDTVSVSWDGSLYDCDFNQQLALGLGGRAPPRTVFDIGRCSNRPTRKGSMLPSAPAVQLRVVCDYDIAFKGWSGPERPSKLVKVSGRSGFHDQCLPQVPLFKCTW